MLCMGDIYFTRPVIQEGRPIRTDTTLMAKLDKISFYESKITSLENQLKAKDQEVNRLMNLVEGARMVVKGFEKMGISTVIPATQGRVLYGPGGI